MKEYNHQKENMYGIINVLDVVNWQEYFSVQETYEAPITQLMIPEKEKTPKKELTSTEKTALGFLVSVMNGDSLPVE